MDDAAHRQVSETWTLNEAELRRLADVPVGAVDPAERERQLDEEQDGIEYEVALNALMRSRNAQNE